MYSNSKKSLSYPVITIDGPSGSGKGTISNMLAEKLGWHFLDSGALYRVLTYLYVLQSTKEFPLESINLEKINLKEDLLEELAVNLQVEFIQDKIFINNFNQVKQDITQFIRSENCGNLASKLAVFSKVRTALLVKQRGFLKAPGLVADGRDMGTVVFPDAILKFFLEADVKIRANRRYLQLKDMGVDVKLHNLIGEVSERDSRDMQRSVANLRPAQDAILIDTTAMTINEVFAMVMDKVILIV
ncbi:MAG: (d)CMP kinase [Gammaproteobacteria bacterium]|jgi:cytidylate kinase